MLTKEELKELVTNLELKAWIAGYWSSTGETIVSRSTANDRDRAINKLYKAIDELYDAQAHDAHSLMVLIARYGQARFSQGFQGAKQNRNIERKRVKEARELLDEIRAIVKGQSLPPSPPQMKQRFKIESHKDFSGIYHVWVELEHAEILQRFGSVEGWGQPKSFHVDERFDEEEVIAYIKATLL